MKVWEGKTGEGKPGEGKNRYGKARERKAWKEKAGEGKVGKLMGRIEKERLGCNGREGFKKKGWGREGQG